MSYIPRLGSKVEKAVDFIRQRGSARSAEIAEHIDCALNNLTNILRAAVENGLLVTCEVTSGSGQKTNEYRVSASGIAPSWKDFNIVPPHHKNRPPRPESKATGQVVETNNEAPKRLDDPTPASVPAAKDELPPPALPTPEELAEFRACHPFSVPAKAPESRATEATGNRFSVGSDGSVDLCGDDLLIHFDPRIARLLWAMLNAVHAPVSPLDQPH